MHHTFHITVPSARTDDLLREIDEIDEVITVAVHRGASHKPPGDTLDVDVLNRGSDRLLALVDRSRVDGDVSVRSSLVESLIDPAHADEVAGDVDEIVWEDAETSLRHHTQLGLNYLLLMALGGVVGACALLLTTTTQATALVAAALIAPGFEPLAKLPLAIVLRKATLFWRGLRAAVVGYAVLAAAAALTILALDLSGYDIGDKLFDNHHFSELVDPTSLTITLSAVGAVAGVLMISAGRMVLLPGALIALQLIPAAALVGASAEQGNGGAVVEALARLGIDVALVIVAGVLVFGYKQVAMHRRRPMV